VNPGVPGQESRGETRPGDLSGLIGQLDSDDFATREQATAALMGLGSEAREALLAARSAGSLERKARIDQVLHGMAARAARRPVRKEPTLVSIDAAGKPLSEVLAELSASSGNVVRTRPGADPAVTLSVRDLPWFEALDRLGAATGRRIGWDHRERGLVLEPATEKTEPVAYAGPVRVALVMLMLNRQIRFAGGGPTGSANLQLRVDAEERSQALGVMMPIRVAEFVDDKKRSLRFGDGQAGARTQPQYVQRCDQRRQLQCFVPMAVPEADAKSIARLELALAVLLPTELYEAELATPEKGSEAGEGGFHVVVEDWKEDGAQREVRLAITRPAVGAGTPSGPPVQDDVVSFFGPMGQAVAPITSAVSGDQAGIVYVATLPLSPAIARIRVTCLKQFEVAEFPIVFENVPLP
jgi:hypothetical protein